MAYNLPLLEEPMIIDTKAKFYDLWLAGLIGNRLGAWRGGEYPDVSHLPFVGIRCMVPGGVFRMPVKPRDIEGVLSGLNRRDYIVCQGTPDQYDPASPCQLVVQGELRDDWYFYHSFSKLPMRDALTKHGHHAQGSGVREYLTRVCTPSDMADIEDLFELYPGHVIELSVYTRVLGCLPNRKAILWEVRAY